MADKTFGQVFEANMKAMGLPVPTTIFGTVGTTLGTVGALAGAIAKVGASATLAEVFLTVPLAAGGSAAAVAVTEIVAVCGAVAASFYVGACIGSVLVAAYETLDIFEILKIASWLKDIENIIGVSADDFLYQAISFNGQLSPIRTSVVLAKKLISTTGVKRVAA